VEALGRQGAGGDLVLLSVLARSAVSHTNRVVVAAAQQLDGIQRRRRRRRGGSGW